MRFRALALAALVAIAPSLALAQSFPFSVTGGGGVPGATGQVVYNNNTLSLANGTNPQTFNVYSTYTDASDYSRASLYSSGGVSYLLTQGAGTGSALPLEVSSGSSSLYLGSLGGWQWQINGGPILAAVDNSYNIGASGASRPANLYLGGAVYEQNLPTGTAATYACFTTGGELISSATAC